MRNFYNDLSIDECFEYLADVFDEDKKNFFFVHTFTIGSLIQNKVNIRNKDFKVVNLLRNPYEVLNSSIALARNGYENSIVMKKHITRSYGNILNKINSNSIKYVDQLSKSIGLKNTMITLFAVDSVKIMLDESQVGNSMNIKSYYIEELTNEFEVTKSFITNYVSDEDAIELKDIVSFQKMLGIKSNVHSKEKKDKLFENGSRLLEKVLNSNAKEYRYTKNDKIIDVPKTSIQNIATDFYRDFDSEDLKLKKEIIEKMHEIIEPKLKSKTTKSVKENEKLDTPAHKIEGIRGVFKRLKNRLR
jgi:hypothetical protein